MFTRFLYSSFIFLLIMTVSVLGGIGCSSDEEEPEEILTETPTTPDSTDTGPSTFQMIQTSIFDASCANSACHAAPTIANGLDLTATASYANLVNVRPQNNDALAAGMLRVDSTNPDNSFLLTKLTGPTQAQGERMPRSSGKLHDEKIEAIRKWIAAGAPQTGIVEGIPDLSNLPDLPLETFAPPPPPVNGVQLHLPPFDIPAGTEREVFFSTKLPINKDLFVNKIEIFYPSGSHHFILYEILNPNNVPDGFRNLDPNQPFVLAIFDRRFIAGTQTEETTYEFPKGVAIRFPADGVYDLNAHFLNLSGVDTLKGEVYVNLHAMPEEEMEHTAQPLFHVNLNIFVPPGETRKTGATWKTDKPIHLFLLSSHMHRHGDSFQIFGPNGELLHESFDFNDAPTDLFNPPLFLDRGDGLRYECTHTNHDKNKPIRFGLTSEDEMCIVIGYYYE